VTVTGQMQNGGKIASNGRLSLQTQSFDNSSGTVNAMGRLMLNTTTLPNARRRGQAFIVLFSKHIRSKQAGRGFDGARRVTIQEKGDRFIFLSLFSYWATAPCRPAKA